MSDDFILEYVMDNTTAKLREYLRVEDIKTLLWERLNEARDDVYDELHTKYVPASYHYKAER